MQLAFIGAIATAILGVAFAMQNNVPSTVNFLLWRFDSTLAMIILIAIGFGAIVVALLTTPMTLKRQWQTSRLRKQIQDLERTCESQRSRIAELESQLPAQSEVIEPKPYVGLKQLIVGGDNASSDSERPT